MRILFAAIAIAATGLATSATAAPCDGFTDVDSANTTYCSAVTYLKDKGITLGCGDGSNYCPNDYVTRLQMALFLQRAGRGGPHNTGGDYTTAIGGGDYNTVTNEYALVGGGLSNTASGYYSVVSGGYGNDATGPESAVAGGYNNVAIGQFSSVTGGYRNTASGNASSVGGGQDNTAQGETSFAAGHFAKAVAQGEFVWADGSGGAFEPSTAGSPAHGWSDATNTFNVRATGGVWFVTGVSGGQPATGPYLVPGSGAWAASSDRAVKENFRAIDPRDVLAKVSAMPITSWNYITEGTHSRHLGPVSQDFHSAFLLGSDDKSITSIDESGVALAAIQGLNQKLEGANAKLDAQNAELQRRLEHVEAELSAISAALLANGR